MKRNKYSMLSGPLLPSVISYTFPIILTSVLQLLFTAADLVVVGRFCGSISLGAVSATGSITALMVNLFMGLSVGTGVTVAHAIGGKQDTIVHRAVHTSILASVIAGLILTVAGISLSDTVLVAMDTPENVLPLSSVYMKIYFAGMVFNMVYNFGASILRAAGDTKSPLVFLTIAGFLNVVLNVIFVWLFHMNVAGVALATIISQAVSAVAVVIVLMKRTDSCKLYLNKLRIYMPQFKKILRIGIPSGIQSCLFSVSNMLIQSSVNSFGDVFMSGNGASQNIESFIYVSLNAFAQTSINFVGQNAGAKQYDRIKKVFRTCLGCVSVTGVVLGGLFYLFSEPLLSIYITDSPQAIEYGMIRMMMLCAAYVLSGLMDVTSSALRGIGSAIVPMVISVFGICGIRVLWVLTMFRMYHTPYCLYASYGLSWIITFLCQYVAYKHSYKRLCANSSPQAIQV